MKKSELFLTFIQVPLDFIALVAAGLFAHAIRFSDFFIDVKTPQFAFEPGMYLRLTAGVAGVWLVLFAISGLYTIDPNRKLLRDAVRIFYGCTAGLAVITIYIFFKHDFFNSRFIVLAAWIAAIVLVIVSHLLVRLIKAVMYRAGVGLRGTVLFGAGEAVTGMVNYLSAKPAAGFRILGHYEKFGADERRALETMASAGTLDEVVIVSPQRDKKEAFALLHWCNEHHVSFIYSTDFFEALSVGSSAYTIAGVPVVEVRRTRLEGWGRILKTIADFCGALALTVIFSPVMAVVALAVLIETGRPVIYKNERMGAGGRPFLLYKFRSMRQEFSIGSQFGNQEQALAFERELIKKHNARSGPLYKIPDDPRTTRVGRFIRRWSLDELPQFFNVLAGDMSLVGPRPHQPREVAQYEKHHKIVMDIRPGITGLPQISGRSDLAFEEEVRLDTFYIEHWSLLLDAIILLKTPFIVLKKRKAL